MYVTRVKDLDISNFGVGIVVDNLHGLVRIEGVMVGIDFIGTVTH